MKFLGLQKVIAEFIYFFLIFFLCYTVSNKILQLDSFKTNLIKTTLFSKEVVGYFSILVISVEVLVVIVLLFYKEKGLLFCAFIMSTFTLYISYLRFKGLYEVCGCGGILNGLSYNYHFFINIGLICGALFSFYTFNFINDEK